MKLKKFFAVITAFVLVICLVHVVTIRAAEVNVSTQADLINAVNSATEPTIIKLTNDISLSTDLYIPSGKVITLRNDGSGGPYKLLGADNYDTITVDGVLTIDGIIVTHPAGAYGGGILVGSGVATIPGANGTLFLESGEISGNYNFVGGGVYNNTGTFYMNGGEISNNKADIYGAGVFKGSRLTRNRVTAVRSIKYSGSGDG